MCFLETKWGIISLPWGMLGPEATWLQSTSHQVHSPEAGSDEFCDGDSEEPATLWEGWREADWGAPVGLTRLNETDCKLDQTKGAAKACTFMLRVTYAGNSPEQQPGGRGQRYTEDSGTSSLLEPWGQKKCSDNNSEKRKEDGFISKWLDILSKGDYIV